jgi:hypothetical protein
MTSKEDVNKRLSQTGDGNVDSVPGIDMLASLKMLNDDDIKGSLSDKAQLSLKRVQNASFGYMNQALEWMQDNPREVAKLGGYTMKVAFIIADKMKALAEDKSLEFKLINHAGRAMKMAETGAGAKKYATKTFAEIAADNKDAEYNSIADLYS